MRNVMIDSSIGPNQFPKIILGSTQFGTNVDEKTAFSLMDEYAELGGYCIDTASVYGDWNDTGEPKSEWTIGKWLKQSPHCKNMKIITKGAHYRLKTPSISRVTAACIEEDIQKSLKSLQIDSIDLYFLHRDNEEVDVSEIMPVLDKYVKQGAIKAIGASNWSLDRILEANEFAKDNQLTPFTASQIQWSLAQSTPTYNVFADLPYMNDTVYDRYKEAGIPVLAWSSQSSGIISKVIYNGWENVSDRLRDTYYNGKTINRVENVKALIDRLGISPTQAALGYITCNPHPAAALIGPSSVKHLKDSMSAADVELHKDDVEAMVR